MCIRDSLFLGTPSFCPLAGLASFRPPTGFGAFAGFGTQLAGAPLLGPFLGDYPRFASFAFGVGIRIRPAPTRHQQQTTDRRHSKQNPHRSLQRLNVFANASIWICDETRASRGRAEGANLIRLLARWPSPLSTESRSGSSSTPGRSPWAS